VFIAHLLLARQDPKSIRQFLARYQPPSSHDDRRMMQWTGTEILRRLIGYAQLPLNLTIEEREELLKRATHLVLNPTRSLLG
jgi:5-methylthioribose kinase